MSSVSQFTPVPPNLPVLRYGSEGEAVRVLEQLLKRQGAYNSEPTGKYLRLLTDAVRAFQMAHLDINGQWLKVDGEVGPKTWWAVFNPTGPGQRSGIRAGIPDGVTGQREAILLSAHKEHAAGVHEEPDGANWGDGVTKYLVGIGPAPWCCYFVSWNFLTATNAYLYDYRHGHVLTLWRAAKERGHAKYVSKGYQPRPGDIFIMLYRNKGGDLTGSGHTGFVLRTDRPDKVSRFNTIEGNAGNRVKQGIRNIGQSTLFGFINPWDDVPFEYTPGLIGAEDGPDTTR